MRFAQATLYKRGASGPGGSLSATMTVGATVDAGPPQTWYRGWTASSSGEFPGNMGSMSATAIGSTNANAIYWVSTVSGTSGGQVAVDLVGNWPAGSLSSLTVGGVSQGTFGATSYSSISNTTTFYVGGSSVANPFGTSGNLAIVLS